MSRPRTVAPLMQAPTHNGVVKDCVTMTEAAVHTITLPEGHFVALVLSNPGPTRGVISIMDRDEMEAQIMLMRNAMEDAELLEAGKAPKNATPSLRRN